MGSVQDEELSPPPRRVTVLVTGFGPFQDRYPVNPSFEIARSLPERVLSSPTQSTPIDIIGYANPIRVSYQEVRELVPVLHQAYSGSVDLVVHIGMASGRDYYAIERFGHRDGYDKNKDLDERKLPREDGKLHFPDCPPTMTTSLDCDDIWRRWTSNLLTAPDDSLSESPNVRISEDAGHYLCDYIYFNSLAWYGRKNGSVDKKGRSGDRPVLFLHVPPESDEKAIAKGRIVTTALIQAMVDSWAVGQKAESVLP